jgi:hypothetical protein
MEKAIRHDCEAKEGELHLLGCDMERCPSAAASLFRVTVFTKNSG